MAIWLNRFSIDRLYRASAVPSDRPLALYAKSGNTLVVTAMNDCAQRYGVREGMTLADARVICPPLDLREADPKADAEMLGNIAAWCERFSPVVVLDAPHGLFLDITGCAHLFGGEVPMLSDVKTRLERQGFSVRASIAPTPAACWALAHASGPVVVDTSDLQGALASLPIAALRLEEGAAALLKRLGLKRIGQLFNAPRAAFAARAGQNAMLRLDQALGRANEVLTPFRLPPLLFAFCRLAEPIFTLDALLYIASTLCAELCASLDKKGLGVQRLLFSAFGQDTRAQCVELCLSRQERSPQALMRLFREKFEREIEHFNIEFGFEAARLDAIEAAPWSLRNADIVPPETLYDAETEARLVDRIAVRLGARRIGKIGVRNIHAPERASVWHTGTSVKISAPPDGVMRRPLMLFPQAQPVEVIAAMLHEPPLKFRWRRVVYTIARAEGPERIAPNWLRVNGARARDYYRVEDEAGRRFWLYREGSYDGVQAPRWFLHGLFT